MVYCKAPLWLGLHGWPHHEGATKPAHAKGHWRVKTLKVTEKNQNMGPFFSWCHPKGVATTDKKGITFFLLGSFHYEKSKRSKCMVYDMTFVSLIGFLHTRVEPIITTAFPYMQKKEVFADSGWESQPCFTHLCSHWERQMIKLLSARTFLCVFTRHEKTKKEMMLVRHSPPVLVECGKVYIFICCHRVPL